MQAQFEYDALLFCLRAQQATRPAPSLAQFESLITERWFSGTGFMTTLADSSSLALFDEDKTGDMAQSGAKLNGNPNEIGIMIMVKKGKVVWIEGFLYYDDPWPEAVTNYEFVKIHS